MEEIDDENEIFYHNIRAVRNFSIFFATICICTYTFWACYPLINTIYTWTNSLGEVVDIKYRSAWILILTLSFNILLPFMLLWVINEPKSTSRSDLYFITIILLIFVNVIAIIGFFLYWIAWINTSLTGLDPFNDYRWCCVYSDLHPELCPNTIFNTCNPNVASHDLIANHEFFLHWVMSAVFLVLTLAHLGVHGNLHQTGVVHQNITSKNGGILTGTMFTLVYAAALGYWAAVPLLNTIYINGYPNFAVSPDPEFVSRLYGFQWVSIFLLILNILPIVTFLWAIINNKSVFTAKLNYSITVITIFISFFVFLALVSTWVFNCNMSYSGGSICNSYNWCCKYFANAPKICPNVTPCPVTALSINSEFLQHIIFSGVFGVMGIGLVWLNRRMKEYGVFYTQNKR